MEEGQHSADTSVEASAGASAEAVVEPHEHLTAPTEHNGDGHQVDAVEHIEPTAAPAEASAPAPETASV